MAPRILLLAEDESLREELAFLLAAEGADVRAESDPDAAVALLAEIASEVLVIDRRLCAGADPSLLPRLRRIVPGATVVLLGEAPGLAEAAARCGAYDTLRVPLQPAEVRLALLRAEERETHRRQRRLFERDARRLGDDRPIVASSPNMIRLLEALERAAEFRSPVLLSGETGSGLEVIARAIHAQSARRNRPFVALPSAGPSDERLESELFGQRAEAAHGERARSGLLFEADGGSLFVDEVGALSPRLQRALHRFLREGRVQPAGAAKPMPVDIRVILGTSRDLRAEVAAERFDGDLFQTLDAVRLDVPPLRERPSDIPLLVDHFLLRTRERYAKGALGVADDALERLVAYDWPGNVRELELVLERAVMLASGERITPRELPDGLVAAVAAGAGSASGFALRAARKALESDMIRQALRATQGNRTHAARLLGISHRALLYKVKEYGIRD